MPLKFLKKCRQYNVTSRNLFVISVHHLLDTSTTVDCTISSESKGQDCLDNVCQRLLIQQPELFGLRYVVKGKEDEMKWIDLERSLSRQLEKYAASLKIFLRVRHYVTTGVRYLSDEVSRYYYFLQLKSDIYEGKIAFDIRTAILLAFYCRQAEYDSYQNDKQTKDYLKKSLVLPKNLQGLANDDNFLDSLILDVLQQNAGIQHLSQAQAEEMYIQCCQQLDGYGEERFQAKDTLGNDLFLGLAINGMVVNAKNMRQEFPWKDFHTVTIDKRTIKVEQSKADGSIVGSYIFPDAEAARYFWKLCITQHKFFKRYIDEDSRNSGDVDSSNEISVVGSSSGGGEGITYSYEFGDSREDLIAEQQQRAIYNPGAASAALNANTEFTSMSTPALQQQQHQQLVHNHGLSAANSSALMSSNISLTPSHQSGGAGGGSSGLLHAHGAGMTHGHSWRINEDYPHEYMSSSSHHPPSNILDTRLQSSSCLDLSNNNIQGSSVLLAHTNSNNSNQILNDDAHERERLKAMLPTYRRAPDYETAMQLKYRATSNDLHNLNSFSYQSSAALGATGSGMSAMYAGSQPDVHNAGAYGESVLLASAHRYPDVAQPAAAMHSHHPYGIAAATNPSILSAGSLVGSNNMYIDSRLHRIRSKPPPPYPVNRLSSSSTPDLAVASPRPLLGYRAYVSGSSPDLVSNRNLMNSQYLPYAGGLIGPSVGIGGMPSPSPTSGTAAMLHPYSYMAHIGHSQPYLPPHGTFENLNIIEEQPSIMSQLRQSALSHNAAVQASQSYEPNSSIATSNSYHQSSAPQNNPTASNGISPAPLQRNAMNGSIEPIYENVPLPQYVNTNIGNSLNAINMLQRNSEKRSSGSSTNTQDTMRNRTSSIQSAPPGGVPTLQHQQQQQPPVPAVRHHHNHNAHHHALQQQQQQQQHNYNHHQQAASTSELDETSAMHNMQSYVAQTHADRAQSTELHYLEPTPPQRAVRAASAAPAFNVSVHSQEAGVAQTPPPRQHRINAVKSANSASAMDVNMSSGNTSATMRHASSAHEDSLHKQFGAMNLSSTSGSSSMYNSTLDTTATNASSSKEPKRKKRWNFLGRSKTPDKQKSATLGREKASTSSKLTKIKLAQDDMNLHRWSTGVSNKLQPISGQYSKDKLCQILDSKLNDAQLYKEFEAIPKRRDLARYDCALLEENALKNSDPNFLPYDENRVRILPTMDNRHGYVNASHISATVGTNQRFYIVAQSPHDELTKRIFWQCVWEADVYLVVQLSENLNYIPPNSNQRLEFGQIQVYQEFSQTTDRCITSKLRLFHIQTRRYRSVWHLNYTDWAEQNCPRNVDHFLDFLEELNSVRIASIDEVPPGHNTNPPVLMHCLEGGGRSGVTLTADLLLYTLDHNEDLDIPRVIGQLRHQRDSIIPSLAQYKFIYSLLITYLKRTRLI